MGNVILLWVFLVIPQFDLIPNLIGGGADIVLYYDRFSIGLILKYWIGVPVIIPPLHMNINYVCRCRFVADMFVIQRIMKMIPVITANKLIARAQI